MLHHLGHLSLLADFARCRLCVGQVINLFINRHCPGSNDMKSLFKNDRGATVVEFALVALPLFMFILGIIQTAWIVWTANLLHMSVDAAARCGAVNSTTSPCSGSGSANMISAATTVFQPLSGASFASNASCAADGGAGLVGTYNVSILVANLTLTESSCYPTVSP